MAAGRVEITSAHALVANVWAQNTGGGRGDSARDVRAYREHDQEVVASRWERLDAQPAEPSLDEDQVERALLADLGLDA